jgi:hypothetical protein
MSALTPLYLLGLLAVAAPIIFHLIRRAPKGEVPFSSLLFLTPSPPRLTRRSRLDNILLLLLRAAVLCLLAFAFARPFLREKADGDKGDETQRRTAILVDTSASLRRGDLWAKARDAAHRVVAECRPTEELAVIAFDRTSRTVLGFRESSSLEPGRRQALALARIDELKPTWQATDIGQALIDAIAAIEDVADKSERAGRMPRRIVLISDLQQGGKLEALGQFEWPKDVELVVKTVPDDSSNAGLQRLADPAESATPAADRDPRVRVFNDTGSRRERFRLQWAGALGESLGDPVDAYVPPGESRVVRIPRAKGPATARAIVLKGDSESFDNTLYVVDEPRQEATVLFIGDDRADDPDGLLFYLSRVFVDTPRRTVKVVARPPTAPVALDPAHPTPLVILAAETNAENANRLREHARAGSTVLYVATRPGSGATLATLLDAPARPIEESRSHDALIGEIAFDHPLFAPFAAPQFSDFTKIHFWKHRKIAPAVEGPPDASASSEDRSPAGAGPVGGGSVPRPAVGGGSEIRSPDGAGSYKRTPVGGGSVPRPALRVLARFDDGDPAVIEKTLDKGSVIVMAAGWSRADGQLARSSKFVPLMMAMLDRRDPRPFDAEEHLVGDPIALPTPKDGLRGLVVRKPSGEVVTLPPSSSTFDRADEPGLYTVDAGDVPRSFVVNLDPTESKTSAMNVETLEQYGCRLENPARERVDREQLRQLQNAELEGRQKLWRTLVLAAIGILIVETGLAGRNPRARPARAQAEAPSS